MKYPNDKTKKETVPRCKYSNGECLLIVEEKKTPVTDSAAAASSAKPAPAA